MTISKPAKIVILLAWIPICIIYYNNYLSTGYSAANSIIVQSSRKGIKQLTTTVIYKAFRPDIFLYSKELKRVLLVELTVPWETNIPKDHALKTNKYYDLKNELTKNGFVVNLYSVDVGARGSETYLINTPGCSIPNYGKTLKFKEPTILSQSCGVRAVFVHKIDKNKIELKIDKVKMDIYSHGKTYECCVRFAYPKTVAGKVDLMKLEYTSCTTFKNGSRIQLEHEIVTVSCSSKANSIYEDAYIILKKLIISDSQNSTTNSWNILVLGMDTMSRARLLSSMPQTAQYLRQHNYLDFRGYQKVGYNTFPNVISLLTGNNASRMYSVCSKGLENCSKYLLWNKFKDSGYTTAYGEEFLRLPDTFSRYDGFQKSPTDHYMRPFFLTGEASAGNYICTKKMSSVNHLLDYAYQFSNAYKKHKFYGVFWINSCSHNSDNNPTIYDKDFLAFFEKMHNDGVMDNTFVIFISDHGIRFGSMRVPMESYYEERLPMCHMWVPEKFREMFPKQYMNIQMNQERLVTPYDMYLTMTEILKISQVSNELTASEGCPLCKSLFEELSAYRNCTQAGVDEKWCSCHNMNHVDKNHGDVISSVQEAMEKLNKRALSTETKHCTECYKFKLKTILRSHSYEDSVQNVTYYVLAFNVEPENIGYEAVVKKHMGAFDLIPFMDTLSPYNSKGSCVIRPGDRGFCVCRDSCQKKVKVKKRNG